MPTQFHVPVPPEGAEEINAVVARVRERGQRSRISPRACRCSCMPTTMRSASALPPGN